MKVETLKQISVQEQRSVLRVVPASEDKQSLVFLYIGSDHDAIRSLSASFETGLIAEDLDNAKQIIQTQNFRNYQVDFILLDVAYNEKKLSEFTAFLKTSGKIAASTPVIYNERHIAKTSVNLQNSRVDDVIDLPNWHFDFSAKIAFLKKAKEYTFTSAAVVENVKPPMDYIKRTLDILASAVLLLMLSPVLLLIALAVRLESRGPIFYNAKRAGRGYKIFKFYKFRTMVANADKKVEALSHLNQYGADDKGPKFFKIVNDPRITKVGRFLRNTSLDELPQLFNVLKGDMSLVGNRPLPLYEAATLTTNDYVERFMAPAGITGLWQIKKRGTSDMSVDERINLDISYARKGNLKYDLWIMMQTPKALIQQSNV
jgi:lipopolysaccharide/colanic/teichoic acid biosynthesis glycosyltransferase